MGKNKKVIGIISIVLIVVLGIFGYKTYSNNHNYKNLCKEGDLAIEEDNFDKAVELFNKASKYKKNKEIEEKLELIKTIKKSKEQFFIGGNLFNEKKYLESIETYKKVDISDKRRYADAQIQIVESYINISKIKEAEQHIKKVENKVEKDKLKDIYKVFYTKQAEMYVKSDKDKAIHLYQKAGSYGLNLKKEQDYLDTLFKFAANVFHRNRMGYGTIKCYMGNFDGKKLYDNVLVTRPAGGSNGYNTCSVYIIRDGECTEIFNDEKDKFNIGWDFNLQDDKKVLFESPISPKKYEVDISEDPHVNKSSNYTLDKVNQGPEWEVKDFDNDGISEIQCKIAANGSCHGDHIAFVASYLKYNSKEKTWEFKEYDIVNSSYTFKEIK